LTVLLLLDVPVAKTHVESAVVPSLDSFHLRFKSYPVSPHFLRLVLEGQLPNHEPFRLLFDQVRIADRDQLGR
jgi:hypothetical protein